MSTLENRRATETYLDTVGNSSVGYTPSLAGKHPASSAVVLCFHTQISITRSDVVPVSDIHRGESEVVGRHDNLDNLLET